LSFIVRHEGEQTYLPSTSTLSNSSSNAAVTEVFKHKITHKF